MTKLLGCIENLVIIKKILTHLEEIALTMAMLLLPEVELIPTHASLFG